MFRKSSFPIQEFYIFQDSGLLLYHQTFNSEKKKEDGMDPLLFAGLTSGILSFSKELGNELTSFQLKGFTYHIKRVDSLIFVFKIESEKFEKSINNLLAHLFDDEEFITIISTCLDSQVITIEMQSQLDSIVKRVLREMS